MVHSHVCRIPENEIYALINQFYLQNHSDDDYDVELDEETKVG